jgi:guanylate kinase
MIYVISAPSGAGKTTIIKEIFKILPGLKFSVSATTRQKRKNEADKKDYYFISKEDFQNKVKNDEFVEWEDVYGSYYGTLKNEIEKNLNIGNDLILDVDVKGALSIKKLYPESVIFFIDVPKEELVSRLKKRNTESEEQIAKRAERIGFEIGLKNKFDHVIENSSSIGGVQLAVNEIVEIINKYKHK